MHKIVFNKLKQNGRKTDIVTIYLFHFQRHKLQPERQIRCIYMLQLRQIRFEKKLPRKIGLIASSALSNKTALENSNSSGCQFNTYNKMDQHQFNDPTFWSQLQSYSFDWIKINKYGLILLCCSTIERQNALAV